MMLPSKVPSGAAFVPQGAGLSEHSNESRLLARYLLRRLEMLIRALFINKYAGSDYEQYIGDVSFDKSSRAFLLRIVGLLSDFTDYQV